MQKTKKSLLILMYLLSISTILIGSQFSNAARLTATAQTNTTSTNTSSRDFLTYEDATYGVSIRHPSDWQNYTQRDPMYSAGNYIIGFRSPDLGTSLDIETEGSSQSQSLEEFATRYSNPQFVTVTESQPTVLGDFPAQKLVYTSNTEDSKIMHIFAKADDRIYVITYGSEEGRYPAYLPVAQEMIDSFRIFGLSDNASAGSGGEIISDTIQGNLTFGENATTSSSDINETTTAIPIQTNQTSTPSSSLTNYENMTYGIRMQYPSDWEKQEYVDAVTFLSPLENDTDTFREGLGIIVQTIPSANMTLDNFTGTSLASLQQAAPGLQIVNSSQTTVANSIPAHVVEYTWVNPQDNTEMRTLETYAIADGKGYTISYGAHASEYDLYLPTIRRMLNSFEVLS